jgi:hypothetical protein
VACDGKSEFPASQIVFAIAVTTIRIQLAWNRHGVRVWEELLFPPPPFYLMVLYELYNLT